MNLLFRKYYYSKNLRNSLLISTAKTFIILNADVQSTLLLLTTCFRELSSTQIRRLNQLSLQSRSKVEPY